MTIRNLSTFSFSPGRYLWALGLMTLFLIGVVVVVNSSFSVFVSNFRYMFDYQVKKMDANPKTDTVFIGDSSLGFYINALLWSKLARSRTLNLALPGNNAYLSDFYLLRRFSRRHRPKNVFFIHNIDAITTKLSTLDYEELEADLKKEKLPLSIRLQMRLDKLSVLLRRLVNFDRFRALLFSEAINRNRERPSWESFSEIIKSDLINKSKPEHLASFIKHGIVNDYIRPYPFRDYGHKIQAATFRRDWSEKSVWSANIYFLRKISEYCRKENLRCFYAHGPKFDFVCRRNRRYIKAVTERVLQVGLPVISGTPFCVPAEDLGDTNDHIRPGLKDKYTRKFFRLVSPYLK